MTPEQQQQFNEMYQWFKNMQKSSAIPRSTEMALRERLLSDLGVITDGGDGGSVSVSVYNSFDVNVPVVSGKRTLTIEGVDYDFLYQ